MSAELKITRPLMKSPLRYPGGKYRAVKHILPLIPAGTKELLSPFIGGGSVEIAVAGQGVRVYGYDSFPDLVYFWQQLLRSPDYLIEILGFNYPPTKENFYRLQKKRPHDCSLIAARFYILNRCSFSGSTLSGGMSPGHPRFTEHGIAALADFRCPNLTVECAGFKESLARHPGVFAYCDPPYLIDQKLYGVKGNTHKGFDHKGLSEILHNRAGWILSYNDCPEIREMYSGYQILTPEWSYGMGANKKSRELIIVGDL